MTMGPEFFSRDILVKSVLTLSLFVFGWTHQSLRRRGPVALLCGL